MRWKVIKKQQNNFSWGGQNKINSYSLDEIEKAQWKIFSLSPEAAWPLCNLWGAVTSAHIYLCPPAQGVVSGTGALILTAVNLSGERNPPRCSRAQAAQVLGGRFSIQLCWIRWLYRGRKEAIGLLGRTQERGEAELLLLDLVTFVTTPPLIKELDTFCLPTRHFGGFDSPWATISALVVTGLCSSSVTLSMVHRLCSHLPSFMNVE